MRVDQIRAILDGTFLTSDCGAVADVDTICAGDLMSDVLRVTASNSLLLTGLSAPAAVYTADMLDVKVVCFVRAKQPDAETIRLAESRGIALMSTPLLMFESCGRLYAHGLRGAAFAVERQWSPSP